MKKEKRNENNLLFRNSFTNNNRKFGLNYMKPITGILSFTRDW